SKDERHGLEALRAGAQDVLLNSELDGARLARALRHAIERNRLHAALLDLALVDELTGLYNRRGFLTLATRDLRVARRGDETLLVVFADLDDLKRVNDTAGHAVGDRARACSTAATGRATVTSGASTTKGRRGPSPAHPRCVRPRALASPARSMPSSRPAL